MKFLENIDNHKLMYHPERVNELLKTGDCYPIYMEIGLTNRCNHRCKFCALDFLVHGGYDIDKQVMLSTLQDMANRGLKSIMFAGEGEPLLHKDIGLFTQKAKEYGLDISMTTNGIPFTQKKREQCLPYLTWIRFSADSGDQEAYAWIHGTKKQDFKKLIYNIEESVKFKNKHNLKTSIAVQTLTLSENMSTLEDLTKICRDIGVDNVQIKPYSHHPQSKNDFSISVKEWNELERLKKYEKKDFKILHRKESMKRIIKPFSFPECLGAPLINLIDSKTNIIQCNIFYDEPLLSEFKYGNLYEKDFEEIWKSKERKENLQRLRQQGTKMCRKGCRLSAINEWLWGVKQGRINLEKPKGPPPEHINFI